MNCDWCDWAASSPRPATVVGAFGNTNMQIWICYLCDMHAGTLRDRTSDFTGGIYAPQAEDSRSANLIHRYADEWELRKL